jgi:hypothetical protein
MTSEPNDSSHDEKAEPHGPEAMLTRRTLLGAAAGGFALAASGLLLPERLVPDAAADDHPVRRVQGRKDDQRGQRRRRLERRREQDRRHDKDKNNDGQVGEIYKDIAFVFEVSGGRSVRVSAHNLFPSRGYLTDRWVQQGSDGPYAPGSSTRVDLKSRSAALWIDKNLWLKAENTLLPWENPVLWFGYGGSFEPDGEQPFDNGTFVAKSVLNVGNSSYKLERDGYSVQAIRLGDDEKGNHKVFNVKIVTPSA